MKPITASQVESLINVKQNFCDCYLASSLSALANTVKGRKVLQENVLTDGDAFCVRFNNVYNQKESYIVKQEECDDLILTDKHFMPIFAVHNPIMKVFEVAMKKLLTVHKLKKPLLLRSVECIEVFEYNKPSNFLKMFTGIKPITLNESSLNNSLRFKEGKTFQLLDTIADDENASFVAGTGFSFLQTRLQDWHCYNIKNVNKKERYVILFDNRQQNNIRVTYEQFKNGLKYICGYSGNML